MILRNRSKDANYHGKMKSLTNLIATWGKRRDSASPLVGAAILIVTVFDFSSRKHEVGDMDAYLSR